MPSEEVEEEEEEEEEIEEEETQFFSNSGKTADDDNWLDFGSIEVIPGTGPTRKEEEESRKRIEQFTGGLVDLDFGL